MRERLVIAFVGLTIAVVALYGVPWAYIVANATIAQEQVQIERALSLISVALDDRELRRVAVTNSYLDTLIESGEQLSYQPPESDIAFIAGAGFPESRATVEGMARLDSGATVVLSRSGELVAERVTEAVTPLLLIGLLLIAVSVAAGILLSRRLARPFQELAGVAAEMGTGRFDVEVPHYRVREANDIALALRSSSAALRDLVQREQEFASTASHQLRTPITALRLQLEDLSLWPDTPATVCAELEHSLHELDRLSSTVTDLLELARGQRLSSIVDLDVSLLGLKAVTRWTPLAAREGRRISAAEATSPVTARLPSGPLQQILDVLIENSLRHGVGVITVRTRDAGTHLELGVADEGERPMGQAIFRRRPESHTGAGQGIGLSVAKDLANAMGGHLRLDDTPQTSFTLMLPKERVASEQ